MKITAITVKAKLMKIVKGMESTKEKFVADPKRDFTRKRKLPLHIMIMSLIQMQKSSLDFELTKLFKFRVETPTKSAFIQQRKKILPDAFANVFHELNRAFPSCKKFKGYRLVACDGSDLNIARNPLDEDTYFQSSPTQRGFNQVHINALYDLCAGRYLDALIQPGRKQNEFRALCDMVDRYPAQDQSIFIGDRGFESYNVLAHIQRKGMFFVLRARESSGILNTLVLPDSHAFDIDVSFCVTRNRTKEIKANRTKYHMLNRTTVFDFIDADNPTFDMSFRAVRFETRNGEYMTVFTNLNRADFPPDEIKALYKMRWGIESSFRDLKHTIALLQLHGMRMAFALQEIFARLTLYNFARIIMNQVVCPETTGKYARKLNFAFAMRVCHEFLNNSRRMPASNIEALIRKHSEPIRGNRSSPRYSIYHPPFSFGYR